MRRAAVLLLLWLATGPAIALAAELPVAANLRMDGDQARRERLPILVFFASRSCPYCYEVEELYLKPRLASGEYRSQVIMRVVYTDGAQPLRDFRDRPTDHAAFARRYGVTFTPTIKMLDADGVELVPGLVGLTTRDFYGAYLDEAISGALTKLRAPTLSRNSFTN
jgi:thioredoxin-related protein